MFPTAGLVALDPEVKDQTMQRSLIFAVTSFGVAGDFHFQLHSPKQNSFSSVFMDGYWAAGSFCILYVSLAEENVFWSPNMTTT